MSKLLVDFGNLNPSSKDFINFCRKFICLKTIFCIWYAANEPLMAESAFGLLFTLSFNLLVYSSFLQWKGLIEIEEFPSIDHFSIFHVLYNVKKAKSI